MGGEGVERPLERQVSIVTLPPAGGDLLLPIVKSNTNPASVVELNKVSFKIARAVMFLLSQSFPVINEETTNIQSLQGRRKM